MNWNKIREIIPSCSTCWKYRDCENLKIVTPNNPKECFELHPSPEILAKWRQTNAEKQIEGPLIVFRIQDVDGRGPWKPGFSHRWVEDRSDHVNLVPWIFEFGATVVKEAVRAGAVVGCGCCTMEQLRRWFTASEYSTLLRYGYRAVRMEVGQILAESQTQCLFGRSIPLAADVIEVELYGRTEGTEETK